MVPGARETFAAILGEEVIKKEATKKSPALAAPSKLKTSTAPSSVPSVKASPPPPPLPPPPPPPAVIEEKPVEEAKPIEKLETVLDPEPVVEEAKEIEVMMLPLPIIEEVPQKIIGEAENLSLQFSLDEACTTMDRVAEVAVGAGKIVH